MGKNRDMYINYKHSKPGNYKKRQSHFRNRKSTVLKLLSLILVIAVIIGFSTLYIIKDLKLEKNNVLEGQDNSFTQLEEESRLEKIGNEGDTLIADKDVKTETESELIESEEAAKVIEGDDLNEELDQPDTVTEDKDILVKGIYVTGPRAGMNQYMEDLIRLVDTTVLNAMVIDIKNDNGEITYKMNLPMVEELGAGVNYITNIEELIDKLKEKEIYLIARVVAFKDPILAKGKPELSLKKKDGTVFQDKNGDSWVNPYKEEVWDYLVSIGKEAALLGFDEIQFDYIRFSTDLGMKEVDYGKEAQEKTKVEVITEFTKYVCDKLKPLGVYVSADVYGTIIDSKVDSEIVGQNYVEMAKYLDFICPMIYPSHYQNGAYGIETPDLEPYNLIYTVLNKSQEVLKQSEDEKQAVVRSWLQDFTASWLANYQSYGPEEINAQIQAVYDAGYDEWILWNGNNNYTEAGLMAN